MDVNQLLNGVKNGTISIEAAEAELKQLPYEDLGFAKLDHHRSLRSGFPEVIFCQGKTCEQVEVIFERFVKKDAKVLATRASKEQYETVKEKFPDAVCRSVFRSGLFQYISDCTAANCVCFPRIHPAGPAAQRGAQPRGQEYCTDHYLSASLFLLGFHGRAAAHGAGGG